MDLAVAFQRESRRRTLIERFRRESSRPERFAFQTGAPVAPFDPSQHPRGQPQNKGEFGPGGGGQQAGGAPGGGASAQSAAVPPAQPAPVKTEKDDLTELKQQYGALDASASTTQGQFKNAKTLTYTPKRAALHQEILKKLVGQTPKRSKNPTFTMFGGGPACGKSTVRDSGILGLDPETLKIDPDEVKNELPEYGVMQKWGDPAAASYVHKESSDVSKRALVRCFMSGASAMLDGTGNFSAESVKLKIGDAKAHGFAVNAEYVTCSTDEAIRREAVRAAQTKRKVPVDYLRETHKAVSQIFPQAVTAGWFDHARLWDSEHKTPDGKPTLVMEAHGKQITIHDQGLWNSFLLKGRT